jgi:hypothetical protein
MSATNKQNDKTTTSILKKGVAFETPITDQQPSSSAKLSASKALLSLHPSLQPPIENHIDKILSLTSHIIRNTDSKAKLSDTDFVPRALRFQFELTSSNRIKNERAFVALQEEAKNLLDESIAQLKNVVVKTNDLEIKLLQRTILSNIFNGTAFLISTIPHSKSDVDTRNQSLFQLLKKITTTIAINSLIAEADISRESLYKDTCIAQEPESDNQITTDLSQAELVLQNTLTELFITPISVYKKTVADNKHAVDLRKMANLYITEKHHDDVTEMLDVEQSVSHDVLNKLIDDKMDQKLKKLTATMQNKNKNNQSVHKTERSNQRNSKDSTTTNTRNKSKSTNSTASSKNNKGRNKINTAHKQDADEGNTFTTSQKKKHSAATDSNDSETTKNVGRGAKSASLKKKPTGGQQGRAGERSNASPKRKHEESNANSNSNRSTGSKKKRRQNKK